MSSIKKKLNKYGALNIRNHKDQWFGQVTEAMFNFESHFCKTQFFLSPTPHNDWHKEKNTIHSY